MRPKVIERKNECGKTEFGVRYADGHEKWFPSMPDALRAFGKAILPKR